MRKRLGKSTDKKDGIVKKSMDVLKKSSENEKRKKDMRKLEKKSRPKGYRAKKLGAFTFWMLFLFMLLIVFVNIFSTSGNSNAGEKTENIKVNKALAAEGVEFSKDFVSEYFTWNIGDKDQEQRVEKLSYYLPKEINAQAVIADKQWKSTIAREDIILKEVEDLADNRARITFQVKINFENFAAGQGKKENDKKSEKGLVVPEKIETVKYISVPILYDDEERRFAVYELPSFTYLDERKIDESIESETEGLKPIKDGSTQNVRAFMETFFEAYANDSKDKLTYIVEDPQHQNGLNQTMSFVGLKNTEIFEGKKANEKIVKTDVVLAEPKTGIEFTSTYILVLAEREMRYTVLFVNNKQYIDELKDKEIANVEKEMDMEGEKDN
ncbi:conjugal transfer protein [Sporosarcina sp. Marseille-Q4063]|uniref:conjugal transfer protein n=1 Tax=Sporosarcina sp. Marseille-Q4063 TaxID=2810514 RepID=UPI001BB05A00|nr:conjugal transfer protein [Sporosarcina sp. Marseille-Q4063]QUW20894.1 conjugal transfer protein [Sporosarcina sp. Marseille-Q4063]